jgi:hypothetical protein
MEAAKERVFKSTQQICDFFYDRFNVEEAVELMGDQDINADFVKEIYNQLSTDADKSTKKRYHYFDIKSDNYSAYSEVSCWTSRYLLMYGFGSVDPNSHKIQIVDLFNDKST